jgi:serine/threonine-protein kinase
MDPMKTCPSCRVAYADSVTFCPNDGAPLRPEDALEPGTIIRKKYRIISEIARGGMGVVYRARHLLWNEDAAIKLLLGVGADAGKQSASFLSEALVMRQFRHPNIVRVEDVDFTEDDKLFIVMEYVQGESLQQRMIRGPLRCEEVLELAVQACAGLSAAHQKGIIHRDIKPQNLLLAKGADGSDTLKIIDFGLAKVREDAGPGLTGATTSTTGIFMGTPEYASPEQAMGMRGDKLDARTDLYSLGLVMFEMLTGARPFAADTLLATLNQRVQSAPPEPRAARPDLNIPPGVSALVAKAMARERDSRYGSAEEMLGAIRAELDKLRGASSVETVVMEVHPASTPGTPTIKKSALPRIAAVIAVLAAAALIAWFVLHRPAPAPPTPRESATAPAPVPAAPTAPPTTLQPNVPETSEKPERSEKAEAPEKTEAPERPVIPAPASTMKVNPQDGLKYVWIPPGNFTMGCSPGDTDCDSDESPPHEVTIGKGFWMGQTEVTQETFQRVLGNNPSNVQGASLPVESVNWFRAHAYCNAVGMRLPTEAEWEYAARGGSSSLRYGIPGQTAWFRANSDGKTHDVAQKQPNAYGLYDLLGNVAEWTADWYAPYPSGSVSDPQGPAEGEYRILRGASCLGGIKVLRVSARAPRKPGNKTGYVGFRCAGN